MKQFAVSLIYQKQYSGHVNTQNCLRIVLALDAAQAFGVAYAETKDLPEVKAHQLSFHTLAEIKPPVQSLPPLQRLLNETSEVTGVPIADMTGRKRGDATKARQVYCFCVETLYPNQFSKKTIAAAVNIDRSTLDYSIKAVENIGNQKDKQSVLMTKWVNKILANHE